MKNKKILIISLLCCSDCPRSGSFGYAQRNSISKHSLIYADVNDNKLISYKISRKRKPGFWRIFGIFACRQVYRRGILLCFQGRKFIFWCAADKERQYWKTYQLSFCPDEIAAPTTAFYCLTDGNFYCLSTADNTETYIKTMFILITV